MLTRCTGGGGLALTRRAGGEFGVNEANRGGGSLAVTRCTGGGGLALTRRRARGGGGGGLRTSAMTYAMTRTISSYRAMTSATTRAITGLSRDNPRDNQCSNPVLTS